VPHARTRLSQDVGDAHMLSRLLSGWTGRRGSNAPAPAGDDTETLLARGIGLHRQDRMAEAERCYLQVLAMDPRNADALNLLGAISYARLDHETALDYFQSAAALAPAAALYHENVGLALGDLGRLDESLAALRRAHELDPESERIGANLLYLMRVHPEIDEVECHLAHRAWAARHVDTVPRLAPATGRCADSERRLRIAYVSGDFRAHAVGEFLEPLFTHRNRDAFEVFCYRTLHAQDDRTERFRVLADGWHDVFELADDAFADLIRAHRIRSANASSASSKTRLPT